jgi:hypothetical protein
VYSHDDKAELKMCWAREDDDVVEDIEAGVEEEAAGDGDGDGNGWDQLPFITL